jgi:SAM-dependent methyltransferase
MSALPSATIRSIRASDASDYDSFAAVYSRWIGKDFAERALPVIERLLAAHVLPGSHILDLCCGAGHIAAALAERGYTLTGVDASVPMLQVARRAAPQVSFIQADARSFTLQQTFDAVISTFNSFAHFPTDELSGVFRNVRAVLRPGGVFLFDLTMEEAYRAHWRGEFSSVTDDHACIVRPTYDAVEKRATNYVTAFERDQRGAWRRSDFVIVQNCHPRTDVECALTTAGFSRVDILDAEHDLGMIGEAGRAWFLCR